MVQEAPRRRPRLDRALLSSIGATPGGSARYVRQAFRREQRINWAFDRQTLGADLSDRADRVEKSGEPDRVRKVREDLSTFLRETKGQLERDRDRAIASQLQPILTRVDARQMGRSNGSKRIGGKQPLGGEIARVQDQFHEFLGLRDQAQLYAAGIRGLTSMEPRQALRAPARAALAIYAGDPDASDDAWTMADPLPDCALEGPEAPGRRGLL